MDDVGAGGTLYCGVAMTRAKSSMPRFGRPIRTTLVGPPARPPACSETVGGSTRDHRRPPADGQDQLGDGPATGPSAQIDMVERRL